MRLQNLSACRYAGNLGCIYFAVCVYSVSFCFDLFCLSVWRPYLSLSGSCCLDSLLVRLLAPFGTNSDGRCCVVPAACNDDSREAVMRETSPKSPRARRWPIKFVHRARSASYTHIHKASSSSSNHHYQQQQSNSEPSCIPSHHCLSLSCSTVLHIYVRICVCTIWSSSSFFGRRMCVGLVRQRDPKLTFNGLLEGGRWIDNSGRQLNNNRQTACSELIKEYIAFIFGHTHFHY